jgi:hypothetical protein
MKKKKLIIIFNTLSYINQSHIYIFFSLTVLQYFAHPFQLIQYKSYNDNYKSYGGTRNERPLSKMAVNLFHCVLTNVELLGW